MTQLIQRLLDWLAALPPTSLYLLASLFMVLETSMLVGLIVPGDAVVLLAATTVTTPGRFALLVAAATLGSLLGESIGYLIGRRFGGRVRFSRLGQRLGDHNWARASAFLNGRGARALLGVRFVAVAHALVPVVAGAVRLPYWRFIRWCAAGATAWSVTYVSVGAIAGASWRQYGDRLGMASSVLLAALLAAVLLARAIRNRRRRQAAADPSTPRDESKQESLAKR
jgi:membrane-associated protein